MSSPVILRSLALLLVVTTLVSCQSPKPEPLVDITPLGDAVRFLAIAIVLGGIISGVFQLWGKD